jgi:hypothetical protein
MSTERFPSLALSHDGFVAALAQSLLRECSGQRLHPRVPVDYGVVGVYHVDGITCAGFDQGPYSLGKLPRPLVFSIKQADTSQS